MTEDRVPRRWRKVEGQTVEICWACDNRLVEGNCPIHGDLTLRAMTENREPTCLVCEGWGAYCDEHKPKQPAPPLDVTMQSLAVALRVALMDHGWTLRLGEGTSYEAVAAAILARLGSEAL